MQVTAWSHHVGFQHDSYKFACSMFIGLGFNHDKDGSQQTIDLRIPAVGFLEMMDKWPHKDYFAGQYDTTLKHLRRDELQQWCDACGDKFVEPKHLSDDSPNEIMDSKESPGQLTFNG